MSALIGGDSVRRVLVCISLGVALAAGAASVRVGASSASAAASESASASESESTAASAAVNAAAALFKTKCTGCHTFGKGIRVGPDLKNVTDRRARPWLIAWIRSSTKLIQAGDATAVALFEAFKRIPMPDHDLSDTQILALLDFLAADGPETEEQHGVRDAMTASAADVDWGRRLFYGESRLKSGDLACVACHTVSHQTMLGGHLADDLTTAYVRYRDRALDRLLKQPCVSRAPALGIARAADRESLALRAFLRSVGGGSGGGGGAGGANDHDTHAASGSMPR
jgi:cytochrome c2